MLKGGGRIINTGSITSLVATPQIRACCTSKHALAGLTKSAAIDYADQNIRVCTLARGPVDTYVTQQVVLWLASSKSSYVTSVILPADGGYVLP
jgi:NAD(P)-dependent dehydrogenase (short-subunit alcohol dehydrogenase family)